MDMAGVNVAHAHAHARDRSCRGARESFVQFEAKLKRFCATVEWTGGTIRSVRRAVEHCRDVGWNSRSGLPQRLTLCGAYALRYCIDVCECVCALLQSDLRQNL